MALLLSHLGSFTFKSSWLVLSLLFGRASAVCPLPPVSEGAQLTTITHDGVSRSWYTYVVMFVALIALAGRRLCKKRLPPLADAGVLETVRAMTTNQAPWFILELARGRPAGSRVFRLRLPIMEHFVVIADPELRRTIESTHHMDKPGAEQHTPQPSALAPNPNPNPTLTRP